MRILRGTVVGNGSQAGHALGPATEPGAGL